MTRIARRRSIRFRNLLQRYRWLALGVVLAACILRGFV